MSPILSGTVSSCQVERWRSVVRYWFTHLFQKFSAMSSAFCKLDLISIGVPLTWPIDFTPSDDPFSMRFGVKASSAFGVTPTNGLEFMMSFISIKIHCRSSCEGLRVGNI